MALFHNNIVNECLCQWCGVFNYRFNKCILFWVIVFYFMEIMLLIIFFKFYNIKNKFLIFFD